MSTPPMTVRTEGRRAARTGRQGADDAAGSRWLDALGRIGVLARGLLYLSLAFLAFEVVRGSGREADRKGALEVIAAQPLGFVLLLLLVVGFVGHALWRFAEAAAGLHQDSGRTRTFKRIGFVVIGIVYAVLAAETLLLLAGRSKGSEESSSKNASAELLGLPLGRPLLVLVATGFAVAGAVLVVLAARGSYENRLRLPEMDRRTRLVTRALGSAGYVARGLAVGLVGLFLFRAAIHSDPGETKGLDGTLRTVAAAAYGRTLLIICALGLVAFAMFSVIEARYLETTRSGGPRERGAR